MMKEKEECDNGNHEDTENTKEHKGILIIMKQGHHKEKRIMIQTIEQRVYAAAINNDCPKKLALLITAQSKHETGNYTSPVFKTCNNLFGYKYAGQKIAKRGIQSPEGDYYAKYANIEDSVKELADWIKRRVKEGKFPDLCSVKTKEQYAKLLKDSGYYGASEREYVAGLGRWYQEEVELRG